MLTLSTVDHWMAIARPLQAKRKRASAGDMAASAETGGKSAIAIVYMCDVARRRTRRPYGIGTLLGIVRCGGPTVLGILPHARTSPELVATV